MHPVAAAPRFSISCIRSLFFAVPSTPLRACARAFLFLFQRERIWLVKFVAKQPCLICGRRPSDAHHLRFAQHSALGRKVSDKFIVPLCRGHHREVHRSGDEAGWWKPAEAFEATQSNRK